MPHVKHVLLIGHDRVGCSLRAPQVRHLVTELSDRTSLQVKKDEQLTLDMQLFYALLLFHSSCILSDLLF